MLAIIHQLYHIRRIGTLEGLLCHIKNASVGLTNDILHPRLAVIRILKIFLSVLVLYIKRTAFGLVNLDKAAAVRENTLNVRRQKGKVLGKPFLCDNRDLLQKCFLCFIASQNRHQS